MIEENLEAVLDHAKYLTLAEGPPCREDDTER